MIQPPFLKHGSTVGIIAPARKLDEDVAQKAKALLESWGLRVVLGKHLFTNEHSYLSASDEHRRMDFQRMLEDEKIEAIFCARGGYGSTRIIDQLNFEPLLRKPKWIIGFSDITSIHLQLNKLGIHSLHGTMPVLFTSDEQKRSVEALRSLLFGRMESIAVPYDSSNKQGNARGQLIGGNLSLLIDSLGTGTELDTRNKILVMEDVGEYFYKIDRMVMHLKRAHKLSDLAGLVVGHFTDITESTLAFGETVKQIILYHTREYNYPIAFNFPIGHYQPNLPFVHGAQVKLVLDDQQSTLTYINELTSA
jgi:muramoyltetrapeptide carboxypeptidase